MNLLCKCGCKKKVTWNRCKKKWNIYIYCHHVRGRKLLEETKRKISKTLKGHKHSEETKRKISKGNKGKKLSKEVIEKVRLANLGHIVTKETRKKISKSHIGIKHTEETKRKISKKIKGRKLSKEHKREISKALKGKSKTKEHNRKNSQTTKKYFNDPENLIKHSCAIQKVKRKDWKGFVSVEPYCDVWSDEEYKESIRQRDNYQCQNPDCWKIVKRKEKLCIHHIDYNKKNCKPDNLITLCRSCNTRANANREFHFNFYKNIIDNKLKGSMK